MPAAGPAQYQRDTDVKPTLEIYLKVAYLPV